MAQFRWQGAILPRAWLDILVIGDTRCGKSVTAEGVQAYFGLGEIIKGENTSYAGLVGGLSQGSRSGKWDLVWGKIPLNDRKLLIIDEASSLSIDDIGNLSSLRSSGIAEVTKIKAGMTYARTRAIWLSNPRGNGIRLSHYEYPIEAVKDLIGKPEDIARFDYAIAVRETDVSSDLVNSLIENTTPTDNQVAFRSLIYWAWSLQPNDVVWSDKAVHACLSNAKTITAEYDSDIPIVEQGEMRIKIARVAAAVAVRAYSEHGGKLYVLPQHVESAVEILRLFYATLGYDKMTASKRKTAHQNLDGVPEMVATIRKYGSAKAYQCLFMQRTVTMTDIENILMLCRQEAREVIGSMLRIGLYQRCQGGQYSRTPLMIEIMPNIIEALKRDEKKT